MSGYRDQTGYDPYAYERPGPPLRPYNWVQWIGVAFIVIGALYAIVYLLGQAGLVALHLKSVQPFATFPLVGMLLVNSRREAGTPMGTAELARSRRILLITVGIGLAILAAVLVVTTGPWRV